MKTNLKILILIGVPASGKSTWTNDFLRNNPDYVRVSRDGFRFMLRNDPAPEPKIEGIITDLVTSTIHKLLARKLNVIIDNTNIRRQDIYDFINEFKYSADIDFRVFDISLKKAIERDSLREKDKIVGEHRLTEMFKDYKVLMDSFDFQPVKRDYNRPTVEPTWISPLPDCVLVDMDGTLANMGKRNPYDWEKIYKDDLNLMVYEQIQYHKSRGRKIIIFTARDGAAKKNTEDWLELYEVPYDELIIKGVDDNRKDSVVKREMFENHIKGKYNPICVYDDRLSVLKLWYELGVFSFNVNQGNKEF
jgi:predicted kinase